MCSVKVIDIIFNSTTLNMPDQQRIQPIEMVPLEAVSEGKDYVAFRQPPTLASGASGVHYALINQFKRYNTDETVLPETSYQQRLQSLSLSSATSSRSAFWDAAMILPRS